MLLFMFGLITTWVWLWITKRSNLCAMLCHSATSYVCHDHKQHFNDTATLQHQNWSSLLLQSIRSKIWMLYHIQHSLLDTCTSPLSHTNISPNQKIWNTSYANPVQNNSWGNNVTSQNSFSFETRPTTGDTTWPINYCWCTVSKEPKFTVQILIIVYK